MTEQTELTITDYQIRCAQLSTDYAAQKVKANKLQKKYEDLKKENDRLYGRIHNIKNHKRENNILKGRIKELENLIEKRSVEYEDLKKNYKKSINQLYSKECKSFIPISQILPKNINLSDLTDTDVIKVLKREEKRNTAELLLNADTDQYYNNLFINYGCFGGKNKTSTDMVSKIAEEYAKAFHFRMKEKAGTPEFLKEIEEMVKEEIQKNKEIPVFEFSVNDTHAETFEKIKKANEAYKENKEIKLKIDRKLMSGKYEDLNAIMIYDMITEGE